MKQTNRSRAQALLRLAFKVAPQEHARWVEAMASELDHIPDASLRRFALGCLMAAVHVRIVSPRFIMASAHVVLVVGALAWAALNVWFAGRMTSANASELAMFGYGIAATFALGAFATARFGLKATLALGAPLLITLGLAALAIKLLAPYSAHSPVYFALIVEDIAALLIALGIAFSVPRCVAVKQAHGQ